MAVVKYGGPVRRSARRRIRRIRTPSPLAPSRTILVVALAIGGAEAPEPWLRAVLLAAGLIVCYLAGTRDGRRDHAVDLIRARGVDRGARPTTSDGPGS